MTTIPRNPRMKENFWRVLNSGWFLEDELRGAYAESGGDNVFFIADEGYAICGIVNPDAKMSRTYTWAPSSALYGS